MNKPNGKTWHEAPAAPPSAMRDPMVGGTVYAMRPRRKRWRGPLTTRGAWAVVGLVAGLIALVLLLAGCEGNALPIPEPVAVGPHMPACVWTINGIPGAGGCSLLDEAGPDDFRVLVTFDETRALEVGYPLHDAAGAWLGLVELDGAEPACRTVPGAVHMQMQPDRSWEALIDERDCAPALYAELRGRF